MTELSRIFELSDKNNDMLPCANFKVCRNYEHKNFSRNKNDICQNCDIHIGKWRGGKGNLQFKIIDTCCICYEENLEGVSLPKCQHYICIHCFNKCFDLTDPPFYPTELDDLSEELCCISEQFSNQSEYAHYVILAERHPEIAELIMNYANSKNKWKERERIDKRLSKCPICRK